MEFENKIPGVDWISRSASSKDLGITISLLARDATFLDDGLYISDVNLFVHALQQL